MTTRARRVFTEEFKAEAVRLVQTSGKTAAQIARELDLTDSALRNWVQRSELQQGAGAPMTQPQRLELAQLRKENRVLRMERDLLKKAAAFFAKEPT